MSPRADHMSCEEVFDRLEAFIDDEIEVDEAAVIEHHLRDCEDCSSELGRARRTVAALRAIPEHDCPVRIIDNVRSEMTESTGPRRFLRRRWLAAAAAVVIGITGSVSVMRHRSEIAETEALRAANDVKLALATIGRISHHANRIVRAKMIDNGPVPRSVRVLAHTLGPLTDLQPIGDPPASPPESHPHEGSS